VPTGAPPFSVVDANSKLGWLLGFYVQDEWKLTDKLTLNLGLRFDQMYQFVDANQFSPRASLEYKPVAGTTLHLGYARYFTPPPQVIATPVNLALYESPPAPLNVLTPCQPPQPTPCSSPVLPERSHYFDVGVTQKVLPGLEVGVDAYYKLARDLLDDGQFGQAYVLTGFNYDRAYNKGVELKVKYQVSNFRAYANLAWAVQKGTDIVSNQYLFDPAELAYIANHYVFTDHAQTWTGSAGMSYLWNRTRFSADLIYGSGLRSGFANTDSLSYYTQVNVGVSHELKWPDAKPTTLRFDVLNIFDDIHEIRDGSGIGVFCAPVRTTSGLLRGHLAKVLMRRQMPTAWPDFIRRRELSAASCAVWHGRRNLAAADSSWTRSCAQSLPWRASSPLSSPRPRWPCRA